MSALKHFLFRVLVTLLFLAVPVLGVWTFVTADEHGLWFPRNVSTYGGDIDYLFYLIMWMVAVTFVLTEGALVWFLWRYSRQDGTKAVYTHGSHRLEMLWTALPALLLIFIAFSQMEAWTQVKIAMPRGDGPDEPYGVSRPMAEIYASQFDWRVRYPDEHGNFEGPDVVESTYDIYAPVDTKVVLRLRSRDVLHSFFVPQFRLKQDAVPGMEIPVWFEATEPGDYELICAELCGWGHYKMAGKLHVLPKEEYEAWLRAARAALYSNGSED
jgi:cytochrome c oxidase subunit 2